MREEGAGCGRYQKDQPMHENMVRVESAVSATASGNLTWENWTHDCATALGLSGAKNPLGFAVVRYLSDGPNMGSIMGLAMHLVTSLTKRGHDGKAAYGYAMSAIDAWNNLRCPSCMGRGVTDFEQTLCKICGGSGEKDIDSIADVIRDGISELIEAERWIEGQLAARLRK